MWGPWSLSRLWIFSLFPREVCVFVCLSKSWSALGWFAGAWLCLPSVPTCLPCCQSSTGSLSTDWPRTGLSVGSSTVTLLCISQPLCTYFPSHLSDLSKLWLFLAAFLKTDVQHFGAFFFFDFFFRDAPIHCLDWNWHPYWPFKMDWVLAECDRSNLILFVSHGHYCQAPEEKINRLEPMVFWHQWHQLGKMQS